MGKKLRYTTILHDVRARLDISWVEYGLLDTIYHLGAGPSSVDRWCHASKNFLAEKVLGVSKVATLSMIERMIKKGLLEKHPETKHLRTTQLWYEAVYIYTEGKETLPAGKETLPKIGKETLPNNNTHIIKTNNNSSLLETESHTEQGTLPPSSSSTPLPTQKQGITPPTDYTAQETENNRLSGLLKHWCTMYKNVFQKTYVMTNVELAQLRRLMKKVDNDEELKNTMRLLLLSEDDWYKKNRGYTIAVLESDYNKLISTNGGRGHRG